MTISHLRAWLAALAFAVLALPAAPAQAAGTTQADAYLDQVAAQLAQPGVWVDPAVIARGQLSEAEAAELDRIAGDTPGPVRIAVVPATALVEDDVVEGSYRPGLAYPDEELAGQLYDRVGVDGTYAVLVDADSSYDGRSFTAFQYAEDGPTYDVEGALDNAVDCCAPDYQRMLSAFLARAGQEQVNATPWVAGGIGGVAALLAGLYGLNAWADRRKKAREDREVADALRPSLDEEVVELSSTVSALPPVPAEQTELTTRTRTVLDLVEQARHRLDAAEGSQRMDTPREVEEVVSRLSDARYELTAIAALREGRPVPERTAPCFIDPRHGPSTAERPFTPEGGAERTVPVCARCAAELDAGQVPAVRRIAIGDGTRVYWDWDRFSRPYVNGYWQRHRFADERFQERRYGPPPVPKAPRSSGWSTSWTSGGGGSSSRRSFSGRSRSRRSFGGGSSRRSSRRSGGSRRF